MNFLKHVHSNFLYNSFAPSQLSLQHAGVSGLADVS